MEDPWIDYGWICTRCTRETNAKLGEEGHVRGNVRGWLERERESEGGTEGGKGIGGESTRRSVYLYSESCGMARKWNNQ